MPRGQPFTALCQIAAQSVQTVVADLHSHTTASDGDCTPSQLVHAAAKAKLKTLAVTDHDTLAGIPIAQKAVEEGGLRLEIVPGVEVSCDFAEREIHILGLFVRLDSEPLNTALTWICQRRRERFRHYLEALARMQQMIPSGMVDSLETQCTSLGRRHLAKLLEQVGLVSNRAEAWKRFLSPLKDAVPRTHLWPFEDAIRRIHEAEGIAVLAHPPENFNAAEFGLLQLAGLDGMECHFPAAGLKRTEELKAICRERGWLVTGGTDFHGHAEPHRALGGFGLTELQWKELHQHITRYTTRDRSSRSTQTSPIEPSTSAAP